MPRDSSTFRSLLRPVLGHPRVEPLTALGLRAQQVRPAWRFLAREVRASAAQPPRRYRLRIAPEITVGIRHGTGDVVTLGEVFHGLDYQPPDAVAAKLSGPLRILDLGANVGMFGAWAHHRWPGCTVRAYEPDPANAAVLEEVIAANPALSSGWTAHRAAAGATAGTMRFAPGGVALSHLLEPDAPRQPGEILVPVDDVLGELADSDLAKIDIEGGEWAIWTDARFAAAGPRVLVAEYHEHLCPGPGSARETAFRLLGDAGYELVPIVHHDDHGAGMLWAHRP